MKQQYSQVCRGWAHKLGSSPAHLKTLDNMSTISSDANKSCGKTTSDACRKPSCSLARQSTTTPTATQRQVRDSVGRSPVGIRMLSLSVFIPLFPSFCLFELAFLDLSLSLFLSCSFVPCCTYGPVPGFNNKTGRAKTGKPAACFRPLKRSASSALGP